MVATLKIVICDDFKHMFEIVYINKRYLVKQHYFYEYTEKSKTENTTYAIKEKNALIEIIKNKMSFDTDGIDFDISKAECDIIRDCLFEEEDLDEETRSKMLRKFLYILDNIEHDENELKKILIKNTKNTVTSLPPELTEMILKNI